MRAAPQWFSGMLSLALILPTTFSWRKFYAEFEAKTLSLDFLNSITSSRSSKSTPMGPWSSSLICLGSMCRTHPHHLVYHMHCANFPRHLGRLINRCLIAHPEGADTIELAHWAYGEVLPRYARQNVFASRGATAAVSLPCLSAICFRQRLRGLQVADASLHVKLFRAILTAADDYARRHSLDEPPKFAIKH